MAGMPMAFNQTSQHSSFHTRKMAKLQTSREYQFSLCIISCNRC
jgi:hypothetical protein